jgi:hypothetical protein
LLHLRLECHLLRSNLRLVLRVLSPNRLQVRLLQVRLLQVRLGLGLV